MVSLVNVAGKHSGNQIKETLTLGDRGRGWTNRRCKKGVKRYLEKYVSAIRGDPISL